MFKKSIIMVMCLVLGCVSQVFSGEIKAYHGFIDSAKNIVLPELEKQSGVSILGGYLNYPPMDTKIMTEAPNFSADMLINCSTTIANLSKRNGWAVPYVSPMWKDKPLWMDIDGYFYTLFTGAAVLVGNKDRLAKAGYSLPTSWKDLLDPKWKGEILMVNPTGSEMGHFFMVMFQQLYGVDGGWKYLEELNKNVHHYTKGASATIDFISRGEFMIAISSDYAVHDRIKQGYPIVWNIPKEGTYVQDGNMLILKGTKKLEECKKIVDAMGTKEMIDALSSAGLTSAKRNKAKAIKMDFDEVMKNKEKNNNIWKDKFLK